MKAKQVVVLSFSLLAFGISAQAADWAISIKNEKVTDENGNHANDHIVVKSGGKLTFEATSTSTTAAAGDNVDINQVESGGELETTGQGKAKLKGKWASAGTMTLKATNTIVDGGLTNSTDGNLTSEANAALEVSAGHFDNNGTANLAGNLTVSSVNGMRVLDGSVTLRGSNNSISDSLTVSGGTLTLKGASNTVGKGITLSGGNITSEATATTTVTTGGFSVSNNATASLSGNLSVNGGGMTITGGQVTLNGTNNSVAGATNITGGEVKLTGTGTNTFGEQVTVATGAKLTTESTATTTIAQNGFSNAGTSTFNGTLNITNGGFSNTGGTASLNNNLSVTAGGMTVSGGEVSLKGTSNAISGKLTTAAGSTLQILQGTTSITGEFENKGTTNITAKTTVSGKTTNTGTLNVENNGTDTTFSGDFDNQAGKTVKLAGKTDITGNVTNNGKITVGTTAADSKLSATGKTFTNKGTLDLQTKATTNGGTFSNQEGGTLDLTQGSSTLDLGTNGKYEQSGGTLTANISISGNTATIDAITGGDTNTDANITGGKLNLNTASFGTTARNVAIKLGSGQKVTSTTTLTGNDVTINGQTNGYTNNIATYSLTGLRSNTGLLLNVSPTGGGNFFCNFEGANCSLAKVLEDMYNNQGRLSDDYKAFFNALEKTNTAAYREALRALDNKAHMDAQEMLLAMQSSDILDKVRNLQEGIEGVYLKPRYARLQNHGLNTHRAGFEFYANKNTSYGLASVFANYDHLGGADLSSNIFNAGAAARTTMFPVGIFGGLRVGGANTEVKNTRFGHYNQGTYNFHTTHAAAFAGIDRDIAFESTHIIPTAYLAYFFQRNSRFTTEGINFDHLINHTGVVGNTHTYSGRNLFARKVKGQDPHYLTMNLGLSLQHAFSQNYRWSAHAFFERRLNNSKIKSESEFLDWQGGVWYQELNIGKNLIRLGADFLYQPAPVGFFALVGLDYAAALGANAYREYGADLKLGVRF